LPPLRPEPLDRRSDAGPACAREACPSGILAAGWVSDITQQG
jgi:hypothetical protein